ncbi:MAG: MBL fold metallo-hydrolase [Deltaproteobacteria bacterium]|nr:MBL fold metallo-hydrolase [Deltaproteobacteria bacterium]
MIDLKPIKEVKITILIDNYIDVLLPSDDRVQRPPLVKGGQMTKNPVAEHGLSLLIDADGERFIMDFGLTAFGLIHNMEVLGVDPDSIPFGVLSHGHHDHLGALYALLERRKGPFALYLHGDALLERRYLSLPSGEGFYFPRVERERMEGHGAKVKVLQGPESILEGRCLISGEIPRVTDFERGLPGAYYEEEGKRLKDQLRDDMSLYFHVQGKGLLVVSGCAHAGIVNSVLYGVRLSGIEKVYGILGGFHLTGPGMAEALPKTLDHLMEFSPQVICPMHCTGWESQRRLREVFGDRFILSSAGSTLNLSG